MEFEWASEPKRYDWEQGDFVYIPPYCAHKHFNADPDQEARFIVINSRIIKPHGLRLVRAVGERRGVLRPERCVRFVACEGRTPGMSREAYLTPACAGMSGEAGRQGKPCAATSMKKRANGGAALCALPRPCPRAPGAAGAPRQPRSDLPDDPLAYMDKLFSDALSRCVRDGEEAGAGPALTCALPTSRWSSARLARPHRRPPGARPGSACARSSKPSCRVCGSGTKRITIMITTMITTTHDHHH